MSNILVQNIKHTNNTTSMSIDTSGQVSVRGEGSATTTNLQQGLVKCFINQSNGQTTRDSFNVGSLTDSGSGDYKTNFTNNFGNNDYVASGCSATLGTAVTVFWVAAESDYATSDCEIKTLYVSNLDGGGTNRDSDLVNISYSGDLA